MDQRLLLYIREQRSKGTGKDEIKKALLDTGWPADDINAAFIELERSIPPSPPPETRPIPPLETKNMSVLPEQHAPKNPIVNRRFLIITSISLITLTILGGGVYAYLMHIGPFARPPYTEKNLLSGLLQAISKINTSSYQFSSSLFVGERDADAKPFTTRLPTNNALRTQYQNDYQRARDIQSILSSLRQYTYPIYSPTSKGTATQKSPRPFPTTLQQLSSDKRTSSYYGGNISLNDPVSGQPYEYHVTENGTNFKLIVTFETGHAISTLKRSYKFVTTSTSIEGLRVTFTKNSPTYFYLPQEPPKPILTQWAEYSSFLPAEMSGSITLRAQTDWRNTNADWKFNADATGDFGDLTYKFNADALKKDSVYYFKINNIPGLFLGSLSAIKGQWIKIDSNVASSSAGNLDSFSRMASELPSVEKSYKEQRAELTLLLKKMTSIADSERLILLTSPPHSEKIDGRVLYRYDIAIRKEALLPFYRRLRSEMDATNMKRDYPLLNDEGYMTYLQSPEFDELFDYYNNNTTLTLWTDTQGFPSIISYALRIVPPDTAIQLKGKQVNMIFKLALSDINDLVDIQAPTPVKSMEEFIKASTLGEPYLRSRDARRVADIKQTQLALELYFDSHQNYPVRLSDLAPKFIASIPTDPSDKNSYHYTYHTSSKGIRDMYHLGANMEQNRTLSNDRDCNSLSNTCTTNPGSWHTAGAFNGSDAQGCGGERERYCYDVTP